MRRHLADKISVADLCDEYTSSQVSSTNGSGSSWSAFLMNGDRYLFDVELASEWRQFDTDQDAS